jgi:hypothetical protein
MFDSLWQIYQPLADKNFLSDCKKHFHQRVWEMYLGVSLIKNGLDISSSGRGPDFVVNKGKENEIFIEATACPIGSDCILIHNPKANLPIDPKIFSFFRQYKAKYNKNVLLSMCQGTVL